MTAPVEADGAVAVDKLMHIGLGWVSVRIAVNVAVIVAVAEVVGLPPLPLAGLLLYGVQFAPSAPTRVRIIRG